MLLTGKKIPVTTNMSMVGKNKPKEVIQASKAKVKEEVLQ
jgi:hypothetical protein